MNVNKVLYDYITKNHGSVVDLSKKSGIPLIDLTAVLLKENVSKEICMGFSLCKKLNIDVEEIAFNGQIKENGRRKNVRVSKKVPRVSKVSRKTAEHYGKDEIYLKSIRLSEVEKKSVLAYIDGMSDDA